MKLTKLLTIIILGLGLCLTACEDDAADPCDNLTCVNGGTCVDGACDCPTGYTGTNCGSFDSNEVQFLLNNGKTPIELYNGGVPLADIFGKTYQGGLIFYLNTTNGTGLVAAPSDQEIRLWQPCPPLPNFSFPFVPGLNFVETAPPSIGEETVEGARIGDGKVNTDAILAVCSLNSAAKACRDLGSNWFLPSRGELNLMYTNLHTNGHGDFATDNHIYWSSTQCGLGFAWMHAFENGVVTILSNTSALNTRAAKAF